MSVRWKYYEECLVTENISQSKSLIAQIIKQVF